jgi:O-antigen/teichoic acid export membrane protein
MPRLLGAHDEAFVALVLALSLPLNVLWVPAQAMLERSLRFRAVAGLEVGSDVAFYAVALALAATGLGVWAPVGANLAWQTMRLIGSYALAGTVPRPRWSAAEALAAVRFGIPASMPRWRQSAASALVAMVVGAELGAHAVGVVMVAWRAVAALALAARATWRVALATLARIGDDTARLAGAVADAMVLELVALAVPLVVLVWCAGPLVRGLLGAPWAGVARAVPWIAVAALLDATLVVGTAALVVAASPVVVGVGQLVGFGVLAAASAAAVGGLGIAGAGVGYLGGVLATTLPYALARRRIGVRPRTLVPAAECYAAAVPALVASLVHAPWRFALLATLPLPALEPRVRRVVGEAASVAWSLMRLGRRRERLASSNPRSRRVARRVAVGSAITALALLVALLGPLGVPGTQPSGANRGASPIKAGDPPSMRGSHPRTHPRVGPASTTLPALGVYTGPGAARAAASWASSLGVPVVLATDYVEDTTWSTIANPAWQLGAWRTAGFAMTWGIPLLPATGGASLSAAAAGAYDAVFAHLARLLVAYGQGGATLVLGWDPDAPDLPWSVANDQQAAEYRGAWRQVVRTMRAVAGAHFAFEWDMAPAGWPVEPTALWPGDDYVDVVATDVFDTAFDGDSFPVLEGGPFGLDWFAEFAQAHDKPLALAKWGVSAWTTDDTSSAAFVSELVDWAHANHVVAAIAWAQGSWALAPSRTPQAFAALRQAVARLG